jgi:hypothetical protein
LKNVDPEITFLKAHSLSKAKEAFLQHKGNFDLIVMDGKIDTTVEETCLFIQELRHAGFTAPMIAASTMHNNKLIAAGCTIDGDASSCIKLASDIIKALSNP